jgi:hypothetical protein
MICLLLIRPITLAEVNLSVMVSPTSLLPLYLSISNSIGIGYENPTS